MSAKTGKLVTLGRICGVYGVKGWVKVRSYTEPRDNILRFRVWLLALNGTQRRVRIEDGRAQGKNVLAKLDGVNDREHACEWLEASISVPRAELPACSPGEYYWADLEGLEVRTLHGARLGTVDHLIATGAHDVLVLHGSEQRLIPFVIGDVIRKVDLDEGVIVTSWEPEFFREP